MASSVPKNPTPLSNASSIQDLCNAMEAAGLTKFAHNLKRSLGDDADTSTIGALRTFTRDHYLFKNRQGTMARSGIGAITTAIVHTFLTNNNLQPEWPDDFKSLFTSRQGITSDIVLMLAANWRPANEFCKLLGYHDRFRSHRPELLKLAGKLAESSYTYGHIADMTPTEWEGLGFSAPLRDALPGFIADKARHTSRFGGGRTV